MPLTSATGRVLLPRCWFLVLALAVVLFGATPALSQYVQYVNESFTGAKTVSSDWEFTESQGVGASLTAPTIDPDGSGWLRLTEDTDNQSSFVYYDNPISTKMGLVFEFDFVIWSGNSTGDGFTLAIFDANVQEPTAGGYGGSLGYAQRWTIDGMAGGVVGIGFDVHGNFSNPTEGRIDGPGRRQNSIAVRGSAGDYKYIAGTGDGDGDDWQQLDAFSKPNASSRDAATIHRVRITITPTKTLTVDWKEINEENYTTVLSLADCDIECPEEIKFGFTAGTGGVHANHEIRNLEVRSSEAIPEPGALTLALGIGVVAAGVYWHRRRHAKGTEPENLTVG